MEGPTVLHTLFVPEARCSKTLHGDYPYRIRHGMAEEKNNLPQSKFLHLEIEGQPFPAIVPKQNRATRSL